MSNLTSSRLRILILSLAVCSFGGFSFANAQDSVPSTPVQKPTRLGGTQSDAADQASTDQASADQASTDQASADQASAKAAPYQAAIKLLPDTVAGLVRVPDVPAFCEAFKTTNIGRLLEDPSMQPFIESQRERAKSYFESLNNKIGVKLDDIYHISSGEAVLAWLRFDNDRRRPFAVVAVADVRGRKKESLDAIEKIDADLKAGGWNRTDKTFRDETIRVYNIKPKPGQLKVEQIAICLNDVRIIASDRESVVTDLLDAVAGQPKGPSISQLGLFKTVLTRSARAIRQPATADGGTIAMEWFARPFQMGRIVRESINIDRGTQLDILKLLEDQGFDAVLAAGGIAVMAGKEFDLIHKGFVLAPPTTNKPSKYENAARMLQFDNEPLATIPDWIGDNVASLTRINVKIEEAFWAAESLVNDALDDELFREVIDGIRDDEDGPQIDIANNVLPNLDNRILMLTDNTQPVQIDSERLLVAIRIKNGTVIRDSIRKAMEAEPDASKMEGPTGVEIWRVQKGEAEDDFGADLFDDFEETDEDDVDAAPPLLDHWAIALVQQGPSSDAPYLMFSSHPELLVETAKRIMEGAPAGLANVANVQRVFDSMQALGADSVAYDRIARMELSLRAKYQLLRRGELKDSDSIVASLMRRIVEKQDDGQPDPLNARKLPPLKDIEQYMPEYGSFFETTEDGWALTGFFLK
ncbi:membrane or secreted protein [Rubripirellula obstinata]|uniref:membrane or secreted protein n=1 Tax=Rubripirellula obstinata TaxID=406547 RepID=UPI00122CDF3E|nr:membrane or secreted protein [Rubripirellula obstinata]